MKPLAKAGWRTLAAREREVGGGRWSRLLFSSGLATAVSDDDVNDKGVETAVVVVTIVV